MKSMRSLYKKLFHYVPDKRILAYFSMALSAAAVCSYMGAYWFLWQSIVSILVIPVYEKAMYDAIIVVILMILRGILNIASATCSHYLGFRLETNLRKNGLHKLLDASSSFFDHNSSGEIRKIIDDNAAETHKTVAHLIPDNVTAVMTPVLMFVLMFAIDYRLGILLILTTVIGVLQYRKMSGGTEFLSGYSAALQKMSAATVEYVRGMQIIKIFGVTVQYYKTLINSIKEYKQYVYQYMDALDAANCTSILDKFPQREMTVIGAKGVYLSGGEVQRIAIARAILKNANIVIMDEASAAADPENEYELQQAFQKLMRGKTVIMIAHRLSSIQNVDQILFVQNGKVVEQGTHNELMACNGRYKDFQDVYCKANQWRLA